MSIIYGKLYQKEKEFKFFYVDENGKLYDIQKLAWTKEYNIKHSTNVLEVMYQLSLEGWECFSVTIEKNIGFRLATVHIYYFKKYVGKAKQR